MTTLNLILPWYQPISEIGPQSIKFLNDYKLGMEGLIAEVLRLVLSSDKRLSAGDLQHQIKTQEFQQLWQANHGNVWPKFTYDEALDRWLAMVTSFYSRVQRPLSVYLSEFYIPSGVPYVTVSRYENRHGSVHLTVTIDVDYLRF